MQGCEEGILDMGFATDVANKSQSYSRAWFFPFVNGKSRETGFVLRVPLAVMVLILNPYACLL